MGAAEDIALLEKQLAELVIRYEQYFLGTEKREPVRQLADVERLVRTYANVKITNAMLNFRYNGLVAKLNTYKQHWNRIVRLMEEGKYSRDKFKSELHHHGDPLARQAKGGSGEKPQPQSDTDRVYQQLLDARRGCGLSTEGVSRESIAAALDRQKPALMSKYNCRDVEFKVVVENGQPKIKATPKK